MNGVEIITTVTDGFTKTLEGTGSGIVSFFETLFQSSDGTATTLAIVALSMMGLGLGVWMIRKLMRRV